MNNLVQQFYKSCLGVFTYPHYIAFPSVICTLFDTNLLMMIPCWFWVICFCASNPSCSRSSSSSSIEMILDSLCLRPWLSCLKLEAAAAASKSWSTEANRLFRRLAWCRVLLDSISDLRRENRRPGGAKSGPFRSDLDVLPVTENTVWTIYWVPQVKKNYLMVQRYGYSFGTGRWGLFLKLIGKNLQKNMFWK